MQRGQGRDGDHASLLERDVIRFRDQLVLTGRGVLGERAVPDTEHGVPDGEPGDRIPDGLNGAGDVPADDRVPRGSEPEPEPDRVRAAGHQVPGATVETGGVDPDKNLVVLDARAGDLGDAQHLGRAVGVVDDSSHGGGDRGRVRGLG
jgi:hypothetical protein